MRLHRDSGNISRKKFEDISGLISELLKTVENADGSWGREADTLSVNKKINGAMKILLALDTLEVDLDDRPADLFRLLTKALSASRGACDNLNLIFVASYCSRFMDIGEIREALSRIAFRQLANYYAHYHEEYGGFSFYRERCNVFYFGAPVAIPKKTPDMHSTSLYLWGISLILKILGVQKRFAFSLPYT